MLSKTENDESRRHTREIHLPNFVIDEQIGLGDLVKQLTYSLGIKPCGGCETRANALNRFISLSPPNGRK